MSTIKPVESTPQAYSLSIEIALKSDGPTIETEPVCERDLVEIQSEGWMLAALRGGHPGLHLDDLQFELSPIFQNGTSRCSALSLESSLPTGETHTSVVDISALDEVAERATARLLESGRIKRGEAHYFRVAATPRQNVTLAQSARNEFRVTKKRVPLRYDILDYEKILQQSKPALGSEVGDDQDYPVFFTRRALELAERHSRRGGAQDPVVESGSVLLGSLAQCPRTHTFFAIVEDSIEAKAADRTEFSLSFSGETWGLIQKALAARRSRPEMASQRILGQAHGHPFLPDGGVPPCEACATTEVCPRHSASLSREDRAWSRAVFHQQPWQLGFIFGLNARGDHVSRLYGLSRGRLSQRSYRCIEDFHRESFTL